MLKWLVLLLTTLVQISFSMLNQGVGSIASGMMRAFGITHGQYGFLASCLMLGPLAGLFLAGKLLDRYGEKRIILYGAVILAVSMFSAVFIHSFAVLCVLFIFSGLGYCTSQPGGSKAIVQWFDNNNRGLAMGIRQAGLPAAGGIAALMFPLLSDKWGWQSAFFFSGCVVLFCGAIFYCGYHEPAQLKSTTDKMKSDDNSRLIDARLLSACVGGFLLISIQTVLTVFFIPLLQVRFSLTLVNAGQFYFIMQFFGALGRIIMAAVSDRVSISRANVINICMIACSVCSVLFYFVLLGSYNNNFILMIISSLLGFFCYGWYGPWVTLLAEISPPEATGARLGFAMSCNQLSIIISPFLFGLITEVSLQASFYYFVMMAGVVVFFSLSGFFSKR